MDLKKLGYQTSFEEFRIKEGLSGFDVARVIAEHKERYIVLAETGELEAEITGNMRFTARGREDFPAVGDWVSILPYGNEQAVIHRIFPRYSVIQRQVPGKTGEVQIIGTNIDLAFLLQAADRDFNLNRTERYLTLCYSSGVKPVIVITKTDLIGVEKISELTVQIQNRIKEVPVLPVSNLTQNGVEALKSFIASGKTCCLLGSSGVGKSSLLNNLSGSRAMPTGAISESSGKGRHVTSHRELFLLPGGGILIDNPGMREVGIADSGMGVEMVFASIGVIGKNCRFKDCTHTSETGCAVLEALENGSIDRASYENYQKLEKERAHFETTMAEKRKREKIFGKILKDYKKKNPKQR